MTPSTFAATLEEVRQAEVQYIAARRRLLHPQGPEQDPGPVGETLIGLALSGGGIRSATTNLGILQALSRMGILKYVDYLSTVSGGGYIGSCLTSLLSINKVSKPGDDPAQFGYTSREQLRFSTEWPDFPFNPEVS